jgi:hypothetical protein
MITFKASVLVRKEDTSVPWDIFFLDLSALLSSAASDIGRLPDGWEELLL